ncbi:hypothetical protein HII31_01959 [Pseudocercospora fuligena]|uniref:F-box domain-containing protein n=1 Tax=Pseudocercospora fuligena TaxID=685502 RepID=A0A8H6VQA8_9PEZI|nr:hypothetical protein HII31_01959 [Pseudocercospora fuligena]
MIPAIERPATDASAAKAQEVFSTPELMEEILTYLPTDEKLSAMEVQRYWRDTVNGSVKLKRLLGLLPMEKNPTHFYSAFSSRYHDTDKFPSGHFEEIYPYCRSGNCYDDPDEEPDENENPEPVEETIELDICSFIRQSHGFGTRVRQMLLCSGPPLTQMQATMFDPCMTTQTRPSVYTDLGTISSDSSLGFTVGELLDTLAVLRKKHAKCIDEPYDHTHFKLRASLTLDYEDPIMVERRYWEGRRLEYARKRWSE